jgi:hypothetical protein
MDAIERLALLPLRISFGAARLVLGPAAGLARRALGLDGDEPAAEERSEPERPPSTWRPTAPPPSARREPAPVAEPEPEAELEEPVHVESEAELVAESADAGAEDAPGAQISVAEPWEGYRRMKAGEVIARIEQAPREELAVIQLYEGMNRRRRTVLDAAERRLKSVSGPAARR